MDYINAYSLKDIGQYIAETRKAKNMTQQEFAELLGTSHVTLSNLENGKPVSSHLLVRALQILGQYIQIVSKE